MTELDPELAAALAEDADEDPPIDENAPLDAEAQAAVEEVRREVQHPRTRGRPKGSRNRNPKYESVAAPVMASVDSPPPIIKRPMDLEGIWEDILTRLSDRGIGGAEMVTIAVVQVTLGATREEPKRINSIPGEAVAGGRTRSPGEDLQDYLERAIHVPLGTGPAKYRLTFRQRGVASGPNAILGRAEVTLPSAADIRKRWEAAAQLARDKERENDFGPMPRPSYGRPPQAEYAPIHATHERPVVLPAAQAAAPQSDFAAQMLDRVWDMYERERRLAQRLGEPTPPPPDPRLFGSPPPPAPLTKGDVASAVVETLQALGLIPKPGAAQAAATPPLTTPVVAQAVTAPMNAAKEFFTQMREFKKMESEMREMFAPEEEEEPIPTPAPAAVATVVTPPEPDDRAMHPINEQFARFEGDPIMFGKQAEGESMTQYLLRLSAGNPKMAGALLEKGAKLLDSSSFGKLVAAFTSMGGPQAQAAAARNSLPQPGTVEQPANGAAQSSGWAPNIG